MFTSGATRSSDAGKNDYEGFISPLVVREFGSYMTRHRQLPDGTLRASDNWQRGIPRDAAMKSFLRHSLDLWTIHRGYQAFDEKGKPVTLYDTLSAILFNAQVYFHEQIKADRAALTATPQQLPPQLPQLPASDDAQTATLDRPSASVSPVSAAQSAADYEYEQALRNVTEAAQAERVKKIEEVGRDSLQQSRTADVQLGADGSGGVIQNREVRKVDLLTLLCLQAPAKIASQIAEGISYTRQPFCKVRRMVYIAGPMRGFDAFNFPAFDEVRDRAMKFGYDVISPADIDRAAGDENSDNQPLFALRDFFALFFLKIAIDRPYIAMIPGWESSTGATAEFFLARWLGLTILDGRTMQPLNAQDIDTRALLLGLRGFLVGQMAK